MRVAEVALLKWMLMRGSRVNTVVIWLQSLGSASAVRRTYLSAKVIVSEHESLQHAIRELRKLSYQRCHRRDEQTRYDYYVKPSDLRRNREFNRKRRARMRQQSRN